MNAANFFKSWHYVPESISKAVLDLSGTANSRHARDLVDVDLLAEEWVDVAGMFSPPDVRRVRTFRLSFEGRSRLVRA